jgi:hypothetical protein
VHILKVADVKDGGHVDFGSVRITIQKAGLTDKAFQLETATAGTFTGTPDFELVGPTGGRVDTNGGGSGGAPGRRSQSWYLTSGQVVDAIRVRGYVGSRTIELPFEWIDVPLPKEDE